MLQPGQLLTCKPPLSIRQPQTGLVGQAVETMPWLVCKGKQSQQWQACNMQQQAYDKACTAALQALSCPCAELVDVRAAGLQAPPLSAVDG